MRVVRVHVTGEPAGAVREANRLAETADGGLEVLVVLGRTPAAAPEPVPARGVRVRRIGSPAALPSLLRSTVAECDLVHVHGLDGLAGVAVPADRLVVSLGGDFAVAIGRVERLRGGRRLPLAELRRAARVVCPTEGVVEVAVRDAGVAADRIVLVPAAPDTDGILEAPPLGDRANLLVAVGTGERHGRLDRAVAALASLPAAYELVVIAAPEAAPAAGVVRRLRTLADRLGVANRLHVETFADEHRRRRWLRTACTVIVPADRGTPPTLIPEALVAGARVVASDVREHREAAGPALGGAVSVIPVGASPLAIADAVLAAPGLDPFDAHIDLPTGADTAERLLACYRDLAGSSLAGVVTPV